MIKDNKFFISADWTIKSSVGKVIQDGRNINYLKFKPIDYLVYPQKVGLGNLLL
jgi:hypothetical protein